MAIRDGEAAPHFSVRSRRYRYTLCGNGEEELYDHQRDPHEWTNLLAPANTGSDGGALEPELERIRHQLREDLEARLSSGDEDLTQRKN